jgi:hypothetical protein
MCQNVRKKSVVILKKKIRLKFIWTVFCRIFYVDDSSEFVFNYNYIRKIIKSKISMIQYFMNDLLLELSFVTLEEKNGNDS